MALLRAMKWCHEGVPPAEKYIQDGVFYQGLSIIKQIRSYIIKEGEVWSRGAWPKILHSGSTLDGDGARDVVVESCHRGIVPS